MLRALHRWVGGLLALVVMLVAGSGGLLLLRAPYYRALHPVVGEPVTAADAAGYARVIASIEERFAAEGVRVVKFPKEGFNAFHVWLGDGAEALVDPRTGDVLDRWHWYSSVPGFLFELHAHLLLDEHGSVLNGIAALLMVFLALTGVIIWIPRRSTFRLRRAWPRAMSSGDLLRSHAASGLLLVAPVLVFVATGAALIFYTPVAGALSALLDARPPERPTAVVERSAREMRPWPELLDAVRRTLPDGRVAMYYPGVGANAVLTFRKQLDGELHPNGRSYVLVDPYSGEVVQTIDARAQGRGTRIAHAIYPIHAAMVGGPWLVAAAAVSALVLVWLSVSGGLVFVRRLARERRARRVGLDVAPADDRENRLPA